MGPLPITFFAPVGLGMCSQAHHRGPCQRPLPALGAEAQHGKDTHVLALGGSTRQGAPCQRQAAGAGQVRKTRYGRDMLGEGGIAPR